MLTAHIASGPPDGLDTEAPEIRACMAQANRDGLQTAGENDPVKAIELAPGILQGKYHGERGSKAGH